MYLSRPKAVWLQMHWALSGEGAVGHVSAAAAAAAAAGGGTMQSAVTARVRSK
jgi:hypothetical protein